MSASLLHADGLTRAQLEADAIKRSHLVEEATARAPHQLLQPILRPAVEVIALGHVVDANGDVGSHHHRHSTRGQIFGQQEAFKGTAIKRP